MGGGWSGSSRGTWISTIANSTAKKETPLAKNTQPGPKNPNSKPPRAGPAARVAWNWVELRVTAFNNSSLGTNSAMNACHAGSMNPLRIP